ncbi:MAG: hypothetical protein K2Q10_14530, partial [Rhodospirillales bacterium]|nr:hypothetical protein [Rhodospirillales bacterium]
MPRMASRLPFLRLALLAGLGLVPVACAFPAQEASGQPGESALSGRPLNRSALGAYLAGRHAHGHHDPVTAIDFYSLALKVDPENVELLQRAFAVMTAEGRMGEAKDLGRRLLSFDSDNSIAAMLLAVEDARTGDYAAAEKRLSALPKRGLNTFVMPVMVAWARAGQNRIDSALEALAPMAGHSALAALHDFHAALINDLAGRRQAAEQAYTATLSGAAGSSLRAVQASASFFHRNGQPERAR